MAVLELVVLVLVGVVDVLGHGRGSAGGGSRVWEFKVLEHL